mmetsp:Transcript_21998/g.47573  ORF Transcript_21998/g.47573 Transcript_21998/m.47573 type:complete len:675 (-) Transcript_21998:132-2156(-)
MLQTASVQPSNYSLRVRRKTESRLLVAEEMADEDYDDIDGGGGGGGGNAKGRSKSRRELPAGAVATLKAWLLSPEHFTHPYPTPQDQAMLMQKTGIDKKQLKNWFTNARRRIWKPMLKKQIEQGKLTTAGAGVPGLMIPTMPGAPGAPVNGTMDNPHSVQAMRVHYQQAMQQGTAPPLPAATPQTTIASTTDGYQAGAPYPPAPTGGPQYYSTVDATKGQQQQQQQPQQQHQMTASSSIGTLPQMSSSAQLSKTDSHAVLMELFARDQDLVKQATESARLKAETKMAMQQSSPVSAPSSAGQPQQTSSTSSNTQPQHPMKTPSQGMLPTVPTLNSWPHFSSITSLNNLGTMPGVKSITSLSGADLASKGGVNKMGNLAQVKSMESIGKNDSYAFLEVFFGEKSSNNLSGMDGGKDAKGGRPSGENEDNEIGLSLEDEAPSSTQAPRKEFASPAPASPTTNPGSSQEPAMDSGTLKRAYDDALAARGLIAVSRSSEKLTELPAKIQRTLSQDFINKQQAQIQQQLGQYSYQDSSAGKPSTTTNPSNNQESSSSQYPGEEPVELTGASEGEDHVQVPATTKCAMCGQTNVDTQLRPCGHYFHERCLKPSLQTPMGPPVCPIDNIPIQSALLAVPTEENGNASQQQQQQQDHNKQSSTPAAWMPPAAAAPPPPVTDS